MKTLALLTAVWFSHTLAAQQPPPAADPSQQALLHCLMGTPIDTWLALKLSDDQLGRMKMVQEACREECKPGGVADDPGSITNADGSTIMGEVRNILSDEQYTKWLTYCNEQPGTPQP